MKLMFVSIFNSISFFLLYFTGIYLNLFGIYFPLLITLAAIFLIGIVISYIKAPDSNIPFRDVFQKIYLAIYVILITVVIIILFNFLSLSIFTYLVLNAIYIIFLSIIFIVSIRDTYKIISGD